LIVTIAIAIATAIDIVRTIAIAIAIDIASTIAIAIASYYC